MCTCVLCIYIKILVLVTQTSVLMCNYTCMYLFTCSLSSKVTHLLTRTDLSGQAKALPPRSPRADSDTEPVILTRYGALTVGSVGESP